MIFRVRKLGSGNWTIVPDSGRFKDVAIIHAEVVSMRVVTFESRIAVGTLEAIWGATIVVNDIFDDGPTMQALGLGSGKSIDKSLPERLTLDYDGYVNSSNVKCKSASRLLLVRESIYAGGVK